MKPNISISNAALIISMTIILFFTSEGIQAAVPLQIGYQGYITDSSGTALNGSHLIRFYLYDAASDGTQIWNEEQTVSIHDGVFNVQLGTETALEQTDFDSSSLYLEIEIFYSGSGWETLTPRQKVTSTAFAVKSGNADMVGGQTLTDLNTAFVNAGESNSITANMIADSTIGAADLANNSVGSGEIINGSVTAADLADDYVNTTGDTMSGGLDIAGNISVSKAAENSSDFTATFTSSGDQYAKAIMGNASSTNNDAYGIQLDIDSGNSSAMGMYAEVNSPNFYAYGNFLNLEAAYGAYGLYYNVHSLHGASYGSYFDVSNGADSPSDVYGIYNYITQGGTGNSYGLYSTSYHTGSSGNSYGLYAYLDGSDTGDAKGIYARAHKNSNDTGGSAYGGHFIADNDITAGNSYGLYTQAVGASGPRYGLYSLVDTSNGAYENYGVYSKVSNSSYMAYGYYADVDSGSSSAAYGAVIDLDKSASATSNLYGLHITASHAGSSGYVYGVSSSAYAADSNSCYGGSFNAYSSAGDIGSIFGIKAYCGNDTSGSKYAGHFSKTGGGNYAGYFSGNVYVNGTLTATSKSFIQPHKTDPSKEIVYVSLESREHAVIIRGNARLEGGEAVIEMPEDWVQVVSDEGITVNLTPKGQWAPLYVKSESKEEIVVAAAPDGPDDVAFSYCIMGQRDGFQNHQPIQENTHFTADNTSVWEFENRITEDTLENVAVRNMLKSNGIMKKDGKLNSTAAQSLGWKIIPNEKDPHYRQAHKMPSMEDESLDQ